jgi:hypothetical protein
MDVDNDVDGDDEADLPDPNWLACSGYIDTITMDVDTDVDGDDEADLAWIAGEENAFPPNYYIDQENNSDESEDEDEDYSNGSMLLLGMIKGQFNWYILYPLFVCFFTSNH